jgi:hypothetical protein
VTRQCRELLRDILELLRNIHRAPELSRSRFGRVVNNCPASFSIYLQLSAAFIGTHCCPSAALLPRASSAVAMLTAGGFPKIRPALVGGHGLTWP